MTEIDQYVCSNSGASHIRGKILPPQWRITLEHGVAPSIGWVAPRRYGVRKKDYYWVEVWNTRTNKLIYRGDAYGWDNAVLLADRATGVARWAWQMDIRRKALQ